MHTSPTHTVLYHGNCPDGLGAAWVVRQKYGDAAEYIPMMYGESAPDVTGRHVIIADFSFKPMTLRILEEQAQSVVLLDHHETAQEMLANYECLCGTTHIEFDMKRSGAMMAWDHFYPGKEPPALLRHIQDRDIWTWNDALSKPFLYQLDTMPLTFETFDDVAAMSEEEYGHFVARGMGLVKQFEHLCSTFVDMALPLHLDGVDGKHVPSSYAFSSEVGNLLSIQSGTFGCIWRLNSPQEVKVSLRSIGDTNVGIIATRFGGGGHAHAASFTMPIERFPELAAGKLLSPMYAASLALGETPSA